MISRVRNLMVLSLSSVLLVIGCQTQSSKAVEAGALTRNEVTEIIVRYELSAPPTTTSGRPWGSQCVSRPYQRRLLAGREIGGGMQVVRVEPPVSANTARAIATQIERCPHIEWAEADLVQLSVS